MAGKKRANQTTPEIRRQIAQWIIDHPNLTVKQIAIDLSIHPSMVYKIIHEFLDMKVRYSFKSTEKPTEQG